MKQRNVYTILYINNNNNKNNMNNMNNNMILSLY